MLDDVVVRDRGRPVLDGLDLAVRPGEVMGVVGPRRDDLTTLVPVVCDVVPLERGTVEVLGVGVVDAGGRGPSQDGRRLQAQVAGVPPVPRSPPRTVSEELGFLARLHGWRGQDRTLRVVDALADAGLFHLWA